MFIGFFKLTARASARVFISLFVNGQNPNDYKWPEAESNCRPLVFQTSALPTELSGQLFKYIFEKKEVIKFLFLLT